MRNLSALVGMTERMMDLINSTIKVEEYLGRRDWFLQCSVSEYARKKVDSSQNILFSEIYRAVSQVSSFCLKLLLSRKLIKLSLWNTQSLHLGKVFFFGFFLLSNQFSILLWFFPLGQKNSMIVPYLNRLKIPTLES